MTPLPDRLLRAGLDPLPDSWDDKPGLRKAAVLAPWFTRDGEDWMLFTRRHDDLPHHPGQISFPGGRRDGCESPVACALRETEEEIGLPAGDVELLGSIPARLSIAGFWVQVVVGRIPPNPDLRLDPREVAALVEFSVDHLRDRSRWERRPPASDASRGAIPHFEQDGELLWGLTARFTLDLLERLKL